MQKSFDLEEHFKNNLENLDEKDEKLHQYLAESSNPNQKKLSALDVKRYQENQMQLEKERENNIIPDLISNFTDYNKDFFSEDSHIQNSIAESIDYKYFDHINEDSNNISKLNNERVNYVKNTSLEESKQIKLNNINNKENNLNKKYVNVNLNNDNDNKNDFFTERNLKNYNSNKNAAEELKDNFRNNINFGRHQKERQNKNNYAKDGEVDFDEYEEEEEEEEGEEVNEENRDDNKNQKNQVNCKAKIGPDGNIYNAQ